MSGSRSFAFCLAVLLAPWLPWAPVSPAQCSSANNAVPSSFRLSFGRTPAPLTGLEPTLSPGLPDLPLRHLDNLRTVPARGVAQEEVERLRIGMPRLPYSESLLLSGYFLREARRDQRKGNRTEALTWSKRAAAAAPSSLDPRWLQLKVSARGIARRGPAGSPEDFSLSLAGLLAPLREFSTQHFLALNAWLYLLAFLCVTPIFYIVAQYLRHLPHLHHWARERLPEGWPPWFSSSLVWVLLLAPLLWGIGSPLQIMFLIAAMWILLSRSERILIIGLLVPQVLMPLILTVGSPLLAPLDPSHPLHQILSAQTRGADIDVPAARGLFTTNPDDYDLRFTLGGLEKRVGNLVEAKAVYEELLPMRPADPLLRNNLGNVVFELDRPGEALVYYRRAVELDPTLAAPHFNASQALLRELEFHRAREEFNLAHALDPQLVLAASAEGDEAAIRRLIDLDLPSTHLWQRLFRERILLADPGELSRKITGLSLVINLPWSLVLSVFLGALFILHRKSISGLSCSACGKPFCPRCRPTTVLELCPACDRRIEKTAVPELQKRILAQIREVSRRQRRVPLLLLTVALPGTAHLQRSAPFRGFFFLGGTAALFLAWRMRGAVVEAPGSLGTLLSEPTQIIALGIATLAFYGIACLSILRIYHGKS